MLLIPKRIFVRFSGLFLLLICILPASAKTLRVAVSLPDVALIVQAVSGGEAETFCIAPAGADPHSFTLTPDAADALNTADLVVFASSQAIEFEEHIKGAVADRPLVDWPDYAREGAKFNDVPGITKNPHGFWLDLNNAHAMATAIAKGLIEAGADAKRVRPALEQFISELDAVKKTGISLAFDNNTRQRTWVAVVPGVADAILNLEMQVGKVLLPTEGASFAEGKAVQETIAKLKSGEWTGLVCALNAKNAKPGEIARQIARDAGSQVVYVQFIDINTTSYLGQAYYNAAVLTQSLAQTPSSVIKTQTNLDYNKTATIQTWLLVVIAILSLVIILLAVALSQARRAALTALPGAGIFESDENCNASNKEGHDHHECNKC